MKQLELIKVYKSFPGKNVITNLTFRFISGNVYSISGASGIGKSTLLDLISGIEHCTSGTVDACRVSMSFQSANLLASSTVLENVMLGSDRNSRPAEMSKKAFSDLETEKALNLLTALGISDFHKRPAELSGGMQARVGVARALMRRADVYLFDEPFAGLDSENIKKTADVIKENTKDRIVITVIHDSIYCPDFADVRLSLSKDAAGNTVLETLMN